MDTKRKVIADRSSASLPLRSAPICRCLQLIKPSLARQASMLMNPSKRLTPLIQA